MRHGYVDRCWMFPTPRDLLSYSARNNEANHQRPQGTLQCSLGHNQCNRSREFPLCPYCVQSYWYDAFHYVCPVPGIAVRKRSAWEYVNHTTNRCSSTGNTSRTFHLFTDCCIAAYRSESRLICQSPHSPRMPNPVSSALLWCMRSMVTFLPTCLHEFACYSIYLTKKILPRRVVCYLSSARFAWGTWHISSPSPRSCSSPIPR